MNSFEIKSIYGRKIFDSRNNPTVEVNLITDKGLFRDSAASAASKGKFEAPTIDVKQAIKNINEIIAPKLKGKNVALQKEIDNFLNPKKFGANVTTPVSLAVCRAGAAAKNLHLFSYLSEIYRGRGIHRGIPRPLWIPKACFNVINGGVHTKNGLDIQEFMIVPQLKSFSENFKLAKKVYKKLGQVIKKRFGRAEIGDEAGFSPPISKTKEALDLIKEASNNFKDIKIILDCAASQFQKGKKYKIEKNLLSKKELILFYQDLILKYPIIGIEDPFGEEDFKGWREISNFQPQSIHRCFKKEISNLMIVGDDLTVTNAKRIKMARKKFFCNAIIIKINQIGTITKTIEAVKLAKSYSWKIIVAHRSGETNDDFIADLAVGIEADYIKAGAPARPERLAKYHRLLKIENEKNSFNYY